MPKHIINMYFTTDLLMFYVIAITILFVLWLFRPNINFNLKLTFKNNEEKIKIEN